MAFRRRDDAASGGGSGQLIALLGRGCRFEGRLAFEGTVQINGDFKGEIVSEDTVIIGEGAHVEANIDVGSAIVTGTVVGTVRARRSLEVHRPGRVQGDVYTPVLTIDPGVVIEGQIWMEDLDAVYERALGNGAAKALAAASPAGASTSTPASASTASAKEPGLLS